MIEVKIPKDIKNYKAKFIMNLTVRQFVSFAIGLFVMVPSFLIGYFKYNIDLGWPLILIGMPIIGIGFFTYHGMTAEKFAFQWVKTRLYYPETRKYKNKNRMKELIDLEDIQQGSKNKSKKGKSTNSENMPRYNSDKNDLI